MVKSGSNRALLLLELPWRLAALLVRGALGVVRVLRAWFSSASAPMRCPAGHRNAVLGAWTCRCGVSYAGHAFDECPVCGARAKWIACEVCGLSITQEAVGR